MSLNYSPTRKTLTHNTLTPIKINFFSPSPSKIEKQEAFKKYL